MYKKPFLAFMILGACVAIVAGCNHREEDSVKTQSNEPSTTFGKSVKKANVLSEESDSRNRELKKAADSLGDE